MVFIKFFFLIILSVFLVLFKVKNLIFFGLLSEIMWISLYTAVSVLNKTYQVSFFWVLPFILLTFITIECVVFWSLILLKKYSH